MLVVMDFANGFFISQAPLFIRQDLQHSAGKPSMIFGGGGKSSAKGGIVVKVLQKTGFKETEIILPGKTNLRKALLENKIDVYPLQVGLVMFLFQHAWSDTFVLRGRILTKQ